MPDDRARLQRMLLARHACLRMVTTEEDYVRKLCTDVTVECGMELYVWSVTRGMCDGLLAGGEGAADSEHPAAALFALAHRPGKRGLYVFCDVASHLKDERTLRALRDAIETAGKQGSTILLVDPHDDLPPVIQSCSTLMTVSYPDLEELEQIVKSTLRTCNETRRIEVNIDRKGLDLILRNLRGLTRREARQIVVDMVAEDLKFDERDVDSIFAHKRRAMAGAGLLEFVDAPVDLESIGGLDKLKAWLHKRTDSQSDAAREFGLPTPRGLLLLGVQGAGKSLASKAIATAWKWPLLRMDVGGLYDKFIGESERRLREALRQAEMMSPIVLWIDEIEKAFASASSQSSDGGLSRRMFGALLTWMQEHQSQVFLVATANDIEALPPELLRKGRFDEIFFVDLPSPGARKQIFSIHLKRRKQELKAFDLDQLVALSEGFSGAEIEQAIISGLHEAFAARKSLTTEMVAESIRTSPPLSVTMAERIAALRGWAKGRCVPAE